MAELINRYANFKKISKTVFKFVLVAIALENACTHKAQSVKCNTIQVTVSFT